MPTAKKTTTEKTPAKRASATKKKASAKKTSAAATKKTAVAKKPATPKKKPAVKKPAAPTEIPSAGLGLVRRCVAALEEKKAAAIEVFFLGEKSPVTDYCVIATGTSDPHLRALRIELEKAIEEVVPAGQVRVQNEPNSGWCVVDAFDVVVHIFSEAQRKNYALEDLWKNGERVQLG